MVRSVDVVQAYIDRMREVQPLINAVVEYRIEEALREARNADDLIQSHAKTTEELASQLPLLGVPFTAKNSVAIKGMVQNAGSLYYKEQRASRDAEVVSLLVRAGAIPVALTNVPEMCMVGDTLNRIYGSTANPYDTRRTSGGSSGGEGALIAAAGSLVGIGTDLGGSIRIPSLFCGIFGHKPTAETVSLDGIFPEMGGTLSRYNCVGPLCRYAEDLPLMLRIMVGTNADPLELDKPVDISRLNVFYAEDDGSLISPVGADPRLAILKVVNYLRRKYPRPIRLEVGELKNGWNMWFAGYAASGAPPCGQILKRGQEEMDHFREFLRTMLGTSKHAPGALLTSKATSRSSIRDPKFIHRYTAMAANLRSRLETLLGDNGVLLVPGFNGPALFHHQDVAFPQTGNLTSPFSVLQMPVTACPVLLNSEGLPIGIQVVAARGQDRLTLAMAAEIQKGLGGWRDPSLMR